MSDNKKYDIHIEYPIEEIDRENSIDIPVEGDLQAAQDICDGLDEMFPDNRHTVKERTEDA
jgi:hypothetical protein